MILFLKALNHANQQLVCEQINLGNNIPITNREILNCVQKHTGKMTIIEEPNRPGDPEYLVADNIKAGNIEEDFDIIKKADWVVEAVVERIDIKHNLYEKILKIRKKESIISSNTSTIPLKVLSAKMSNEDKKDFCITHFFNPVRYMGLLEIVSETINDKEKINFLKNFCEDSLGKGVIICKDTPGFLGNRVGVYAMQVAMTEAIKMELGIEEADAVFGRPMGIPKTGVFGLYDLIGIDLMAVSYTHLTLPTNREV